MRIWWKRSLALSLGLLATGVRAGEDAWGVPARPGAAGFGTPQVVATAPAVILQRPVPQDGVTTASVAPAAPGAAAVLGKPVPLAGPAPVPPIMDGQVRPIAFQSGRPEDLSLRGKSDDGSAVLGAASVGSGEPPNKMFTWRQAGDELAPPPRLDPNTTPPPRLEGSPLTPPPLPGGASGGFPITPPPGVASGGSPATPDFGFLCGPDPFCAPAPSLSHCGTYPGNELYVSSEGLLWWMKGSPVPPLAAATLNGSTMVLGGTLGSDARAGGRLMLGYWFDDQHYDGLEGGIFVLSRQNSSIPLASPAGTFLNVPGFPFIAPTAAVVSLSSSLWGGEFNYRTTFLEAPNGFVDLVGGFRTVALDETLNFDTMGPGPPAFMTHDQFQTKNRFYGGQMGAVGEWRLGDFVLDFKTKVAVGTTQEMITATGASVGVAQLNGVGFFNNGKLTRSQFSVLPEMGINVGYQYTENLRLYMGYNLMYWSRVIRPGNQASTPLLAFNTNDFWVQGMTLGFELRY